MFRNRWIVLLLALILSLAACSGAPRQIATYPQEKPLAASGQYDHGSYVYDAYIELEVRNPESKAEQAIDLTQNYGGYLSNSQTWWTDGKQQVRLTLMVPVINFDKLYNALPPLGRVARENIYGRWDGNGDGWSTYSQITLLLSASSPDLPRISLGNWHPLDTLRQAWRVSTTLIGFLIDVLVWALVVIGPFVLIGLGLRKLYLKLKS
jgi:Domain of unknown function (DUF4349)